MLNTLSNLSTSTKILSLGLTIAGACSLWQYLQTQSSSNMPDPNEVQLAQQTNGSEASDGQTIATKGPASLMSNNDLASIQPDQNFNSDHPQTLTVTKETDCSTQTTAVSPVQSTQEAATGSTSAETVTRPPESHSRDSKILTVYAHPNGDHMNIWPIARSDITSDSRFRKTTPQELEDRAYDCISKGYKVKEWWKSILRGNSSIDNSHQEKETKTWIANTLAKKFKLKEDELSVVLFEDRSSGADAWVAHSFRRASELSKSIK